jgi:hypothetical protein
MSLVEKLKIVVARIKAASSPLLSKSTCLLYGALDTATRPDQRQSGAMLYGGYA